jgi:hypothetical protein
MSGLSPPRRTAPDQVLEPTRDAVIAEARDLEAGGIENVELVLHFAPQAAGAALVAQAFEPRSPPAGVAA